LTIGLATVTALQRMIAKGLKEPSDKIDLLRVLDLGKVLAALEERTRKAREERGLEDSDDEQFRESLGKLLSTLGLELLDLTKEDLVSEIRTHANQMLEEIYPVTMQFVADEFDDTSSTVFPFVHALLLAVSVQIQCISKSQSHFLINDHRSENQKSLFQVVHLWTSRRNVCKNYSRY
jgi:exportin-T